MKGIKAAEDTRLEGDRAALIEELRAERDAAAKAAEAAAAQAEAELGGDTNA